MTLTLLALGCTFNEHLPEVDVHGTVKIPVAAATVEIDGELVEDPRLIGPVYLGAFPSIRDDLFEYPHPEMGPVLSEDIPGNTYPYGGGTVGRFDFGCFESIACEVVTGRFENYTDVLDFYREVGKVPVTDEQGAQVESADYYRQYCYELFEVTADYEISWVSGEDLDFEKSADGEYYEADFNLWRINYIQNMELWGWVDSPGWDPTEGLVYATCNKDDGQANREYSNDYYYGNGYNNLLNFPGTYIGGGDFVSSMESVHVFTAEDAEAFRASEEEPVITLDQQVTK